MTADNAQKFSFIQSGLIEILGADYIQGLSLTKGDVLQLKAVWKALARQFGEDAAYGLLLRAGRAGFYYWMRQNAASLGWRETDFRLQPAPARTRRTLTGFLEWLNKQSAFRASLAGDAERWQVRASYLTDEGNPLECSFFLGMLQEASGWAGSGKFYPARESACQATGAAECLFEIEKKPAG